MYLRKILIVVLPVILICSCVTGPSSTDKFLFAPLNGKIFDYDNLPCSGVLVTVNKITKVKSDINGRFVVPSLAKGKHKFVLKKDGYETLEFTFEFLNSNQILWLKMTSLDQLIRQIEHKFDENAWDEVENLIARANKIEQDNPVVLYLTAVLYIHNTWYENAIEVLEKVIEKDTEEPIIYLTLADIYQYNVDNPAKALEMLEKYVALQYNEKAYSRIANLRDIVPQE